MRVQMAPKYDAKSRFIYTTTSEEFSVSILNINSDFTFENF